MSIARVFVTDSFMNLPAWHDLYVDFYNLKGRPIGGVMPLFGRCLSAMSS